MLKQPKQPLLIPSMFMTMSFLAGSAYAALPSVYEGLSPTGVITPNFNYGLVAGSHIGMDSAFEAITDRVFELAWNGRHHQLRYPIGKRPVAGAKCPEVPNEWWSDGSEGSNAGSPVSIWARGLGAYTDQSIRGNVQGYLAKGAGVAVGFDWGMNDCSTYGVAISYTTVNIDDKAWAPKDTEINAWQGIIYAAYDICPGIFLNAMVGGARNHYFSNRVIQLNDLLTAGTASFRGTQWGAQGDLGYVIPNETGRLLAPFVRLKYIQVGFEDYSESGAGDLNLTVSSRDADEFLGGIGFRTGMDFYANDVEWLTELMLMVGYDFDLQGEQASLFFLGGGPEYIVSGVTPGKTVFDGAFAVSGRCGASMVTAKYNLELRNGFVGNATYLQYYYTWA